MASLATAGKLTAKSSVFHKGSRAEKERERRMGREYKEKDATVKQHPDGEVDRINVLPLGEIRWMNHDSIQQFVPEVHSNLSSLLQAED